MIAKIRDLNLDDLKNVFGGVTLLSTSAKVPASSAQANQALAAPSRPATGLRPSVNIHQQVTRF